MEEGPVVRTELLYPFRKSGRYDVEREDEEGRGRGSGDVWCRQGGRRRTTGIGIEAFRQANIQKERRE